MIATIVFKINRIYILLFSHLINNYLQLLSNQMPIIVNNLNNDELMLHSPLRFTSTGISNFLSHTYNHPKYAREIVPHNTGHFMQLLEHGKNTHQDCDYMLAVLRLLRQKISETDYMSASELERLTSLIPSLMFDYLDPKGPNYQKTSSRKLKSLIVHTIENCLNKTLWDCGEPDLMIRQFIKIGNNLDNLGRAQIISDEDDLNDLVHSLINRLIYVLKIAGSELPLTFYDDLSKQLHQTSWMNLPEIESSIDSKLKKINQAFLKSRIKSTANNSFGIL